MRVGWVAALSVLMGLGCGLVYEESDKSEDARLAFYVDRLVLSGEQADRVARILSVDQELARIDRDRYRGDVSALAEAADKRIKDTNKEIESVLSPEQELLFQKIKPSNRLNEGVLKLTSRLGLDPIQTAQLEKIMAASRLDEYRVQMRSAGSDRSARMEYMQDLRSEMERVDKEIEKILTDEQHAEYKRIKDERKAQMEAERPQGRKGQGQGGRRGSGYGGGQDW